MTNRRQPNDKMSNKLLFLLPQLVNRVWGGSRLKNEWNFEGKINGNIGECWVISADNQFESVVCNDEFKGKTLTDVWHERQELFGNVKGKFPLLIKLIDAKNDLSIQVHPNDDYANKVESCSGKQECWYILDCPVDAFLYIGNKVKSKEEFREHVKQGEWEQILNQVPVKKGDFIQIDAGTLHTIRGGFLLLEIQQNCDLTYRIYDYDRLYQGVKRELNFEKAMDVVKIPNQFTRKNVVNLERQVNTVQSILETKFYSISRACISGNFLYKKDISFCLVNVVDGNGNIEGHSVRKGDSFIMTSRCNSCILQGEMEIILTSPNNG